LHPPLPPFRPRWPWWGPDLQTLRNRLRPPPAATAPRSRRLTLKLSDGSDDALSALLQHPGTETGPTVVLIHGLAGCEESPYMEVSAAWWLARGHPVLRLNLRGAGRSRPLCRLQYHAGRSQDLRDALEALPDPVRSRGLVLVGYSLGGNMLLKFLAEHAAGLPVRAAACVSAPIDLAATAKRFLEPRNWIYHRSMLQSMKSETLAPGAQLSAEEERAVREARSVWEFDDRFVAPRNGFDGAPDYYARCSGRRFLAAVRTPTLVVHALDDPWIPGAAYREYDWAANPRLTPLLSSGGGHVGFHAADDRVPWHDRAIAAFFGRVAR
jgi:predicted alpha/beta-fold hydrolase